MHTVILLFDLEGVLEGKRESSEGYKVMKFRQIRMKQDTNVVPNDGVTSIYEQRPIVEHHRVTSILDQRPIVERTSET